MRLGPLTLDVLTADELSALSPALLQRIAESASGLSLSELSEEEARDLPYSITLDLRKTEARDHVARMAIAPELLSWAKVMTRRHGQTARVHLNELPWLEALLVSRYGEASSHWPASFSTDDIARALATMRGRRMGTISAKPLAGVTPLDLPSELGAIKLRMLVWLAAAWCSAHAAALTMVAGALVGGVLAAVFGRHDLGLPLLVGSALANFWENELIDHLFRARSYTAPTDHYIALYTAAPGETGGGTEVSGGSYARVQVAAGFGNWEGTGGETTNTDSAGTGGGTQNRNAITFPAPTANWGSVTHFASLDAASGGNFYLYGALTTPKTVNNADPAPSFAVGDLDFSLA